MPSSRLVPVLLALAVLVPLAAPAAEPAPEAGWVCPPCVHSDLDRIYDEPGQCPICGMRLIPRSELVYAAILVFDGVQIIDFAAPYEVFGQAGFYAYTVSPDGGPITTTMDMHVTPHYGLDDAPRPDVLLVPGGQVDEMRADERVLAWIRESAARADHVLSVCTGAFLLAEAGLLDGTPATTFHNALDDLAVAFPAVEVVRGVRFVDNGKVVTAAGLSAGLDAAIHLVKEIQGPQAARRLAEHIEYAWDGEPGEPEPVGRKLSAERLHAYDGVYEFEGGGRATLAGSPKDRALYAFIEGARYPLVALAADAFLATNGKELLFVRGEDGEVEGYRTRGDDSAGVYRRLEQGVELPASTWFARPQAREGAFQYEYSPPPDLGDGLAVGTLAGTGLSPDLLQDLVERIVDGTYPDIHSLLIAKDGKLVIEEYFYQYGHGTAHQLRSATKSVVSALVGIAIEQGLITGVEARVLPFFEEYQLLANPADEKAAIRIVDLLTQRSGLDCDDWDAGSPGNEVRMIETEDWVRFVLDLPMAAPPGQVTSYCSGGVILLGRIVEKVTGMLLPAFAEKYLFGPLGISDYRWRFAPDHSSVQTFCQLSLPPRDMMKLGMLFAAGGRWNGLQVLSEAWIRESTGKHSRLDGSDYGYLWWHHDLEGGGTKRHALLATGNGGQKIHLWEELGLITVLTGGYYNRQSPANEILSRYVLASF